MGTLLLVSVLAVGADEGLQGKWLIYYAEEGGRRNNSWEQRQATLTDNTLKYEADGKEHSIHLKFGNHQTVEASESGGKSHRGVYIAGRDYLCISLETGRFGVSEGKEKGATTKKAGGGSSSGSFILILRRQAAGGENK